MEQMIPVAATALLGGLIAVFLKREAGEIALLLSIATTVLLLVLVGSAAVEILSLLRSLAQQASISDALLTPMLKVLGIEVVTNLAAQRPTMAPQKPVCALYASIPVIQAVLILIEELL